MTSQPKIHTAPTAIPANKRWCYYISVDSFDENGYIPSVVVEDEPGHSPLSGGDGVRPWYWGQDYDEARQVAREANAERGLTDTDVTDIVASSMAAAFPREI